MQHTLEFEKPIVELEDKIADLKKMQGENLNVEEEVRNLEKKMIGLREGIFNKLTPWQKVQLSRHPERPYATDYIERIFTDFIELHGDRRFRDDPAIIAGLAQIDGQSVVVIAQQKGRNTTQKVYRNFGMPSPDGYRKALRIMKLAEKFKKPIVTIIDTPGAYPGLEAEERGQAEAIAFNLIEMAALKTPVIVVVIGEGGSGGALAIGIGDRIFMLEYSIYSVISPEGCAAILWKDATKAAVAAEALKISAEEILKLEVIDAIIKEPAGGAHKNWDLAAENVKTKILEGLQELKYHSIEEILDKRYEKFRKMGQFQIKS